jgi:dipeptidyl aminopeptidase/acylaminoacyl peptidase
MCITPVRRCVSPLLVFASATIILSAQSTGTRLTLENLWKARSFSIPHWSADSRSIAFTIEDPETNSDRIHVTTIDGPARAVEKMPASEPSPPSGIRRSSRRTLLEQPWTPDGRQLLFTADGSIRAVDVASGETRSLASFAGSSPGYVAQEYFNGPDAVLSPDGTRVAFVRESEIWVLDLARGGIRQLTSSHAEHWHNLQPRWSPDGTRLLYTAQATDEQRKFSGLDFSGLVMTPTFKLIGTGRIRVGVISADGGPTTWLGPAEGVKYSLRGGSQAHWSPDGRTIAINRITLDHKTREILLASPDTGKTQTFWNENVDRWISPMAIWIRWSPDSKRLVLTSEETGWNHIYVADVIEGSAGPRALTSGSFTVTSNQVYENSESTPAWSRDGKTIFFPSNEAGTAERHLYAIPANGGARRQITTQPGVDWASTVSPDGSRVAYYHSDSTTPAELYVQDFAGGAPARLSGLAAPDALKGVAWLEHRLVTFPNRRDHTPVVARLYVPPGTSPQRLRPAVIYVHGAGYTQSVYNGWPGSPTRTAFNQYLAEEGYVVLDVDFRGSSGYGQRFRLDVFDRMGDTDLEDVLSGVEYLKSLGYVDASRIGIWGHSYGGFMVSMAMFRAPDTFAAGAAGAPVTDWERFYYLAPGYNEEHLGFPWENKEGTRRASPLTYAGDLRRPFLLISGVQDTMHLDSAALVNRLLEHGKRFEWFFYPNEPHGFRTPEGREDYYRKIAEFFRRHLGPVSSTSSDMYPPLRPR